MFEIASQTLPYKNEKINGAKGAVQLLRKIAKGLLRPELGNDQCSNFQISQTFKKLFARCTAFEPRQRPAAEEVARKLEALVQRRERLKQISRDRLVSSSKSEKQIASSGQAESVTSPWSPGSLIAKSLETFSSNLASGKERQALTQLKNEVGSMLGRNAVTGTKGVWNAARLFRFLKIAELNVHDALVKVSLSARARTDHDMKSKRKIIVQENLSFDTLVSCFAAPYSKLDISQKQTIRSTSHVPERPTRLSHKIQTWAARKMVAWSSTCA